jgi:osmotically-inducible protein OsmY
VLIQAMEIETASRNGETNDGAEPDESVLSRLKENLTGSLRSTGYFLTIPCEITVHVDRDGNVSLHGIVSSFFLKQKAQVVAMSVDGVQSIQNELVVL